MEKADFPIVVLSEEWFSGNLLVKLNLLMTHLNSFGRYKLSWWQQGAGRNPQVIRHCPRGVAPFHLLLVLAFLPVLQWSSGIAQNHRVLTLSYLSYQNAITIFFFFATLWSMQDLSSLTQDPTCPAYNESAILTTGPPGKSQNNHS